MPAPETAAMAWESMLGSPPFAVKNLHDPEFHAMVTVARQAMDELRAQRDRAYAAERERTAELRAEIARLTAELDETQQRNVLNVRKSGIIDAMAISTGEPAGTVIRATDEPGLAFELGEDRQWRRLP